MLEILYKALEKPYLVKYGYYVQNVILFNILLNVFSFTMPLVVNVDNLWVFECVQKITVFIFIIELILRYVAAGQNNKYKGVLGRIRYTFKFYTLVDIVAIVPFILTFTSVNLTFIRALRFVRLLKFIRMEKVLKRFFSFRSFAISEIKTQIFVLFVLSGFFIFLFGYVYNSTDKSFLIFVDPPGVMEAHGVLHKTFAIFEWILGLFFGGALISIITSYLIDISESVQRGYLSFKEKNHIIIIGSNKTLDFILKGINQYYLDHEKTQDIVLFLPYIENIKLFRENLKEYKNIYITIITGDAFVWNSFTRANINEAKKVLILNDENSYEKNHNMELTRYILVNSEFKNDNLEFVIQTRFTGDVSKIKSIYSYMFENTKNSYLLVNNTEILNKFLNRSVVDNDYFKVFLELLSFKSSEFYQLENRDIFKSKISFKDACLRFGGGIVVGVIKDKIMLNPPNDTQIDIDDKLVVILKNSLSYFISRDNQVDITPMHVVKPKLKIDKEICIIGNHININKDNISQFLTTIPNEPINASNEECLDKSWWDGIRQKNHDTIIINLEDKFEFIVTMFLKNEYKDDAKFLSKIVNIIHDPTTAKLLRGKDMTNNIILSDKIVGNYISLIMFSPFAVEIFDEITHMRGSEFYILNKDKYEELFGLNYDSLRAVLLQNSMIYIGAFKDKEFIFNHEDISDVDKILILTEGGS